MALIAGLAMAVESTNIVGYMDKELGNSEYTWACSTFTGIGGPSVSFTLGQFIPNANFAGFEDNITFCDAEGNWEDQLTYVSAAFLADNELDPNDYEVGWYALDDDSISENLNATVVPFAKGFCAYSGYDDVVIKFAGEVPQAATPVALANSEYTWMGNASVANLTLGQLIPNANFAGFEDNITFCDAEGNWEDQLTYVSAAFLADNELDPNDYTVGWYALDDDSISENLNATSVPAGKAFCAYSGYDDVTITIPSPLP